MTNHHKKIIPRICELEKCHATIPLRNEKGKPKSASRYDETHYCCQSHAAIARSIALQTRVPMTSAANIKTFIHNFKKNWWMGNPLDTFNMKGRTNNVCS